MTDTLSMQTDLNVAELLKATVTCVNSRHQTVACRRQISALIHHAGRTPQINNNKSLVSSTQHRLLEPTD